MDRAEFVARVRYFGWLCYQLGAGLNDIPVDKENIPEEMLTSLIAGTKWALENPDATAEDNHKSWMEYKLSTGWAYGEVLDREKKIHPDLVPYSQLTPVEQRKDDMDVLMVKLANSLYSDACIGQV